MGRVSVFRRGGGGDDDFYDCERGVWMDRAGGWMERERERGLILRDLGYERGYDSALL